MTKRITDTRFNRACRGEEVDCVPVWMMRQAGRYMPEYRAIRAPHTFLEFCRNPDLCARATLEAAKYLDTDAAIIFSDITIPAWGMGLNLDFSPGPRFEPAVRTMKEIDALTEINPEKDLPFVFEAIQKTRAGLPDHVSLIGFVGAPLTLAAYMIEGYPDKNWVHFKSMMYDAPEALDALLDKVATAVTAHARAQVEAGCDVIQVFDTNAGLLPPDCLEKFAFKYAERVIRGVQELGVPVVYFAKGISQHLDKAAKMKSDVLGVDWTISMKDARAKVGPDITLQGNLDPCALFASGPEVRKRVTAILEDMKDDPRFVFNLGHGILPKTPPENAREIVRTIRDFYGKSWNGQDLVMDAEA